MAPFHRCGLGIQSPRRHIKSADSRSRAQVGGKPQLRGCRREASGPAAALSANRRGAPELPTGIWSRGCPAGLWGPRAHPNARRRTGVQPASVKRPTRQLLDFRKAPAGGGAAEERAAPLRPERGRRSAPGPRRALADQKGHEWAAARGTQPSATDSQESGTGRAARRGSGSLGAATIPPRRRRGGRARLPGWRAAEVPRSWSGAGAAAASPLRAAAAAGRTGGRAVARS